MKWRVMISAPYMQPVIDEYIDRLAALNIEAFAVEVNERLEEEELLKYVGDIHGAIAGDDRFTDRVFAAAPHMKTLVKWGTGIDSFDQQAAARRGITIRRSTNAFSQPVAETVLAFILLFNRQIVAMDRHMKAGHWQKEVGYTLAERTLGIIGVGDCGKALAKKACALGMRVLGNDLKTMPSEFLASTPIEMTGKDRLWAESDFVSLHTDLNPQSHHLMNDAAFAKVKHGAILINTCRGQVVEESALARALKSGKLAGAGLDVFEQEPLPHNSPLIKMDNVFLTPHSANASPSCWAKIHENSFNMLVEELNKHT